MPVGIDFINRWLLREREVWRLTVDPFILGLFRIALGVYLLAYYVMLAPSWEMFYSPGGLSALPIRSWESYRLFDPLLSFIGSRPGIWGFYAFSVLSALSLIPGWLGKFPVFWLWTANYSIMYRDVQFVNGEEQVLAVLLVFALFLPLNASGRRDYSLRPVKGPAKVATWVLRPCQVYVALIYFISFFPKIQSDAAWRDGTMVYYAVQSPLYCRFPGIEWFGWGHAVFSRAMTYATLGLELGFSLLVWFRRCRFPITLALMSLHAGLAFFLDSLMMFNLAMIVGLILFLPSRATKQFFCRVGIRFKRRSPICR